jgi:AraC family transcriptional regulator of adaptative response/methylated-DNA-[protein]-cysteine methyltransferase
MDVSICLGFFIFSIFTKHMKIQRITTEELQDLKIYYSFQESPFGKMLIANTGKGICYAAFEKDEKKAIINLKAKFTSAEIIPEFNILHKQLLQIFNQEISKTDYNLHLIGTDFQVKVWEELLKLPFGKISTYGQIANIIQKPKSSRAVGTAIGSNPIAYLIPCHRVIQTSGGIGGYMWGINKKKQILKWEKSLPNQIEIQF